MNYIKLFFIFLFTCTLLNAQDYSSNWTAHFSYNHIIATSRTNNIIYTASENVIYSYNTETEEIIERTTINGLSGELISAVHYSEAHELLIIGYKNGLIEVLFDNRIEVLTVIDIFEKANIPANAKRINHFNALGDVVYIATDYGISVYNLARLEFGDTYFIGNNSSNLIIKQTAIFNNYIYAACLNGGGIKRGLLGNDNLVNFQNWETISNGNYMGITATSNHLYTIQQDNNTLYEIIGNTTVSTNTTYNTLPVEIKTDTDNLIVTTPKQVFLYDENLSQRFLFNIPETYNNFTTAVAHNNFLYVGTTDFGLLKKSITTSEPIVEILPNGPVLNNTFSVEAMNNEIWATYGDYSNEMNAYELKAYPLSRYTEDSNWKTKPFDSLQNAQNLNDITFNPFNPGQVFVSSFFSGLLEFNQGTLTTLYNTTNSPIESYEDPNDPNYIDIRISASEFDSNGLLWFLTSIVEHPLKSYNPATEQWQLYSFSNLYTKPNDELGFRDLSIDNNNIFWIASYTHGLIGFDASGETKINSVSEAENNMPFHIATAVATDKNNHIWIGTNRGLRVLYNTADFFSDDNIQVDEIIILEDGIAKELLYQQHISSIEVDGANNKWIATLGSGVFYFSADGQQTIYHFTTNNSPLPSNNVNDISIDQSNGSIYFGTNRGLVAFNSDGSEPNVTLEEAYIYPNPVRPTFNINQERVKIKGLSDNINIKIVDIEGNLVAEAQSRNNLRHKGFNLEIDGGTAFWNGKNLAHKTVASGVYLVLLSDLETFETKVLKIMVIR